MTRKTVIVDRKLDGLIGRASTDNDEKRVINKSSHQLSNEEYRLLNKGLKHGVAQRKKKH